MEWRDVPGYPGYQVSARGGLRTSTGYVLPRRGKRYALHRSGVITRLTPGDLLALAWPSVESTPEPQMPPPDAGAGSSSPAPEVAPAGPEAARHKSQTRPRGGIRMYGARPKRHCHDCGRPTNNYRCDACWARLRGYAPDDAGEWNLL